MAFAESVRNALPELIAAARERDELAAQAHGALAGLLALNNMVTTDSSEPTSAAVQRVLAERDALRAEVERMRAVVEAARTFMVVCEDWVQCGDWESYVALRRALSALDAAKEGDK